MQWEAVQSARSHKCAKSMQAVARGMKASIDHASLYSLAWFCFNETHQHPLLEGQGARTWDDFVFMLAHLEGTEEERTDDIPDEIKNLPRWYQPAVEGIEFRLEAWNNSTDEDRLVEVMKDLIGEPSVADQLTKDLQIEVAAAVALSRIDEPTDRQVEWWARRVYVVANAMNGRVGRLLERHRPEAVREIREMLELASNDRTDPESEEPIAVPKMVQDALAVGLALEDAPDPSKPKRTNRPSTPKEPDLDELDLPPPVVHRSRDLNTGSE